MSKSHRSIVVGLWALVVVGLFALLMLERRKNAQRTASAAPAPGEVVIELDEQGQAKPSNTPPPVLFDAPSFDLIDSDGNAFSSSSLLGTVYTVRFFFSECPGICPMMTRQLLQIQEAVPSTEVRFVSFTVDPARDTPEVLREYKKAALVDPVRNIFLTGTPEQMKAIPPSYKLAPVDQPADHGAQIILVDAAGKVRGIYSGTSVDDVEQLTRDVNHLVAEATKP